MAAVELCPNPSGLLVINNVSLETSAWTVLNSYTPLWTVNQLIESPPEHIGGRQGSLMWAPEIDGYEWRAQFVVIGDCDRWGVPFADPWVGLESNLNYLRTNILDPIPTNRGLQDAVLVMPSGDLRTANVLVRPPEAGEVTEGKNNPQCAELGTGISVFARYVIPLFVSEGLFS